MKYTILLALALIIFATHNTNAETAYNSKVTYDTSYKYLLALSRCKNSNIFTIHGLWPEYSDGSWPQFCNKTDKLNFNNIQHLIPQIKKYWITCPEYNNNESWFLEHEWSKHGTCTPFTQEQYFGTALALYQMMPWRLICFEGATNCLINIIGIA